jgi:hypothetical protein
MLPPGIGFNAISPRALEAAKTARLPRAFWSWEEIVAMNVDGYWPTTPNTNLLYGLHEALEMLLGEGLDNVFARHERWGVGVRAAVDAWGLPIQCADPAVYSPVLTGVITPEGIDADAVRRLIHQRFDLSLGTGLGKLKGRMFRMGHLGDSNDLTLVAMVAGVEMGLKLSGVKRAGLDGLLRRPCRAGRPAAGGLRVGTSFKTTETPCKDVPSSRPRAPPRPLWACPACSRRNGPRARCASWSASRRAAAPTRWPAWSRRSCPSCGTRRSSSRTRAVSPACWPPSTWRRSRATAARC